MPMELQELLTTTFVAAMMAMRFSRNVIPGRPLEVEFLDERFAQAYATERSMLQAGLVMSGLALFIAFPGVVAIVLEALAH